MNRRQLFWSILLVALAIRLWGIGFGLPDIVARPDETEVAGPAVGFLSGDFRPPFFEWPTLFPYTVAALYAVYFVVTRPFAGYNTLAAFAETRRQSIAPFLYVSRVLSAVMGVVTVAGVFAIGRRLFDETVGLAAALLLALSFLHVRDSHFGTTDVPMTALVVLTVLAVLRWRDTGRLEHAALAGAVGGLASSTKYNGLGVCLPFAIALCQRAIDAARQGARSASVMRAVLVPGLVFSAALLAAFFGASPYIAIDWHRFVTSVSGVQDHLLEGHGMNVGQGWTYYATVVLPAALGWPLFAAGLVGMAMLLATKFRDAVVLFAYPLGYYIVAGRGYTVFARYIIPVLPFLCIGAAWAVVEGARVLANKAAPVTMSMTTRETMRNGMTAAAIVLVVAPTAWQSVQLDRLLAATDNRVVVARTLFDTISRNSSLYQSGERYGYVPMTMLRQQIAHGVRYNDAAGAFEPGDPDYVLVQRSPLVLYSHVPDGLAALVRERYDLVRRFPVDADDRARRVYDQQDAFYLPLDRLDGLTRPGPSFDLYRKRATISPAP